MDNLFFKRILITVLVVALLFYVGFLFYNANFGRAVETEEAVIYTASDTIHSKGFFVRKEVTLDSNYSGVLSYSVNNGDNVSVGQSIADIYASENDAVAQQKIKSLNDEISNLQLLGQSYYKDSVGLDTVNSQINEKFLSVLSGVNKRDFISANNNISNLLYYINESQIITEKCKNFKSRINDLKAEKRDIKRTCSNKIGSIKATKAGYYISSVDGFEKSLNFDKIDSVTVDDLRNIKKSKVSNSALGKVVVDPQWYILTEINKDQAIALSKLQGAGAKVYVSIPFVSNKKLLVDIHSINQINKSENAVLVLSCDHMSKDISLARNEDIEINTLEYTGLKISKRAIHEDYVTKEIEKADGTVVKKNKKVQGVYVLYGSELIFKEIRIVYSSKQYVLCNPDIDKKALFSGSTIKLYDQVVIKGDDLYSGKVIS